MDALLSKRKVVKTQVTRIENTILQQPPSQGLVALTGAAVILYMDKVQKLVVDLDAVQELVYNKCKADELDGHLQEYDALILRLEESEILLQNKQSQNVAARANVLQPSRPTSDVRLPPIDLPKFGGQYTEWFPFHDLFIATVHNITSLSGAQKLHYLKNSTFGDAARLIHSLQLTDGNYSEAWDILKTRYHNTREIVDAHIKRLFSQAFIKEESATALRQLLDTTSECVRSLKILQEPVQHWDAMLIHIVKEKLDVESRRQWELSLVGTHRPKYDDLASYLEQRARALAATQSTPSSARSKDSSQQRKSLSSHHGVNKASCVVCSGDHPIFRCSSITESSIDERWVLVKRHSLCYNCLRPDHRSSNCKRGSCKRCGSNHNTLLHREKGESMPKGPKVVVHVSQEQPVLPSRIIKHSQVILPTTLIKAKDVTGQFKNLRALLDSASQATFISEGSARRLNLRRSRHNASIGGIGISGATTRGSIWLDIKTNSNAIISVQALILSKITEDLPHHSFDISSWSHTKGLRLADPTFHTSGPIDVLLGADVYFEVVEDNTYKLSGNLPVAVKTVFGWTMGGPLCPGETTMPTSGLRVHVGTIDDQLKRFWDIEEVLPKRFLTDDEKRCEDHFQESYSRLSSGRFVVRLPFKNNPDALGDSRKMAVRRFLSTERRLRADDNLYVRYCQFMEEYMQLGHMEPVPPPQLSRRAYYLPHHAVVRESSTTTKLRVVFDASAKTSTGTALNDILLVGPKLQDDLVNLLLRFRSFPVVMTADIAKMYRQVLVHPDDVRWQRIIWRKDQSEPLNEYQLLTVTYGTAAAPYQATRVLKQLAEDVKEELPLASFALARDFYMDDLMTGVDSVSEGLQFQAEILKATNGAGLQLRKWSSNRSELLESLPRELTEVQVPLRIDDDEAVKTLGMRWYPAQDHFSFLVKSQGEKTLVTKRTILADTAKIFDPLGLLAPVTILTKILLQDLWRLKVEWDDQLSPPIIFKWRSFRDKLPEIENLKIRRYVAQPHVQSTSLHGFCDASETAFAAAIYMKTISGSDQGHTELLAAKTRVAPLKRTSLPRLELCGAVLLARLIDLVQRSLKEKIPDIHCWTDSTITLAWVASPPHRWKTFVANRVSEIQETLPNVHWHHVSGETNPADCASRGMDARELRHHALWWNGPKWLQHPLVEQQGSHFSEPEGCSLEEKTVAMTVTQGQADNTMLEQYSSFRTLINVTAYMLRFVHNARISSSNRESRIIKSLSVEEREAALIHWVQRVQQEAFPKEFACLRQKKDIPSKSKIISLYPVVDDQGTIRVGGRLQHARISPDRIHPILLPRRSKLTDLIIVHEHIKHFHGGPQLLATVLQRRFWIIGLRDAVRFHVRRCMRCVRQQAATCKQLMGNLPAARVNPARAFLHCGIDYAGPFTLRVLKGRGHKTFKAYVALFACFNTRALHLELVSDLSSEAFLATLKRFVSRRGRCSTIYSDCGTNFVGADRELKEIIKFVSSPRNSARITQWSAEEGIQRKFNPPAAPHFGGLWEAGVRSVKFHLKRVIGASLLNYKEFQTVICQIEACLNSRPLSPMSCDPNDLSALTPGHFLIGGPLTAVPEHDLTSEKTNRLSRWQLGQKLVQYFWKRWSAEYLSRLQQRPKWASTKPNIEVGDLVLLKDEKMPPTKWRMAHVTIIHPGADSCVRVVTVKTSDREFQRPVVKLCKLPLDN